MSVDKAPTRRMESPEEAFAERLYDFKALLMSRALLQFTGGDYPKAEELVQATISQAYMRRDQYNPEFKLATWLISIMRNMSIDQYRADKFAALSLGAYKQHVRQLGEEAQDLAEERRESALLQEQVVEKVRGYIRELPKEQQEAITLSIFEEKTHAEIADMLRAPLGTIKSRIRMAQEKIMHRIKEELRSA